MKIILIAQTQAHVDALRSAGHAIVSAGFKDCWLIASPAIAVDAASASAKFDAEIDALRAAETAAAGRGDYDAASQHKLAREGKTLDRDKAITDAWKSVPEEDRKTAYREKTGPLKAILDAAKINAKLTVLQDHFQPDQWIQMLNSLSGAWFKPFVHGEYVVAWPGAIPTSDKPAPAEVATRAEVAVDPAPTITPKKLAPAKKAAPVFATRRDELMAKKHFGIINICKGLGIDPTNKKRETVVDEILAKEAALQPA